MTRLILLPRDPAWEATELVRADALIDGPPEHRGEGCRILRYLGTSAAEIGDLERMEHKIGQYPTHTAFSFDTRGPSEPRCIT